MSSVMQIGCISTVNSEVTATELFLPSVIIIIIIILRRFLTCHNTTEVITRARINAKGDDMSQHQKISYEQSVVRRYDFNATLKLSIDCLVLMCCGSRFHSDWAATANDRAPNFVAVLAMCLVLTYFVTRAVVHMVAWTVLLLIAVIDTGIWIHNDSTAI